MASAGVIAAAQNLNQTVSITNTYKSGQDDTAKESIQMSLPDSLTQFNYKFDYSVFDTPYRGAFEFSPYAVKFTPDPAGADIRRFFLRAGAGYGLYPQLQAVWTPVKRQGLSLDLHQDLHGYYGNYRTVRRKIDDYPLYTTKGVRYQGYDFSELFGAEGRWSRKHFIATFGLDYNGIFTRDEKFDNCFNSALAGVRVKSLDENVVSYDVRLGLDFAADKLQHPFADRTLKQGVIGLDATVGPRISDKFGLLVDLGLKSVNYGGGDEFVYSYFGFLVAPHVQFTLGPVELSAGVKVDGTSRVNIAPDVHASMKLLDDNLKVYASVSGGTVFNTYSDFKRKSHWFCPAYSSGMTNSIERINFKLGACGSFFSRLQYRLEGGWASLADNPFWAVANDGGVLRPMLSFRDCNYAYADLNLVWKSPRLDIDGGAHFRKSNMNGASDVFDMPVITGDIRAQYNWNRRIFAGVRMNASGSRKSVVANVPLSLGGYVDLGVFGEYRINRRWSVWIDGGNLLNHAIQLAPMHVEAGIHATAGVCLSL